MKLNLAVAWLLCALPLMALAVDMSPPPSAEEDHLQSARSQIAAGNWPAAIRELKRVNDTANADWNNLMGYSHRRMAPPDYPGAERYYEQALKIAPQHRGALEYSGELYLMMGQLPRAEARLQTLGEACARQCEEYADLAKAVAADKTRN
ncbi:hypothetical protein BH11PSE10_BH11PSE10_02220 [soil metagenome]